jgi:hypothetical protein
MDESHIFTAQAPVPKKAPREQPSGLNARYVPYGVSQSRRKRKNLASTSAVSSTLQRKTSSEPEAQTLAISRHTVPTASPDVMDLDQVPKPKSKELDIPSNPAESSLSKPKSDDLTEKRKEKKKKKKRSRIVDTSGL